MGAPVRIDLVIPPAVVTVRGLPEHFPLPDDNGRWSHVPELERGYDERFVPVQRGSHGAAFASAARFACCFSMTDHTTPITVISPPIAACRSESESVPLVTSTPPT